MDVSSGVKSTVTHLPHVILLDLRRPDMDGTAFLQLPAAVRGNARVIVLTGYERDEEIYRAVRAGAQGYLIKDASEAEMVSAICTSVRAPRASSRNRKR